MKAKNAIKQEKISILDEKDIKILNMLSGNSREKLKAMARKIGLSIDATKSRVEKLKKNGVITKFTIQVDAAKTGTPLGVHSFIKFRKAESERIEEFVSYLTGHIRIIDAFSALGDYDFSIVFLAKDTIEADEIKTEIRQKFSDLIADWKDMIVAKIYKLEEYKF